MKAVCLLLVVGALVTWTGEVRAAGQAESVNPPKTLLERLSSGDVRAITEAGRSGDTQFVPPLRRLLNDKKFADVRLNLQVALVKLEDTATQQKVWCFSISDTISEPVRDFGMFGGWYSIHALWSVLRGAGETEFLRALERDRDQLTDITLGTPQQHAVDVLRKIVPDAPDFAPIGVSPRPRSPLYVE